MNMRIERVSLARETQIIAPTRLTWIRFANGRAVLAHPITDGREDAHRFFRNRTIGLWPNVQKIVAAVARTGDQIANDRRRTLPIKVRAVITPTVIQSHAGFPR